MKIFVFLFKRIANQFEKKLTKIRIPRHVDGPLIFNTFNVVESNEHRRVTHCIAFTHIAEKINERYILSLANLHAKITKDLISVSKYSGTGKFHDLIRLVGCHIAETNLC